MSTKRQKKLFWTDIEKSRKKFRDLEKGFIEKIHLGIFFMVWFVSLDWEETFKNSKKVWEKKFPRGRPLLKNWQPWAKLIFRHSLRFCLVSRRMVWASAVWWLNVKVLWIVVQHLQCVILIALDWLSDLSTMTHERLLKRN
jgi:hypothetical protein